VAGIEALRCDIRRGDHDRRRQLAVQRVGQLCRSPHTRRLCPLTDGENGRHVEVDHLAPCVDAGVGASGAGEAGGARGAARVQWPRRATPPPCGVRLGGEAMEAAAVVGEHEPPADGLGCDRLLRAERECWRRGPEQCVGAGLSARHEMPRRPGGSDQLDARHRGVVAGRGPASGCACSRRDGPCSACDVSKSLWAMSLSRMRATTWRCWCRPPFLAAVMHFSATGRRPSPSSRWSRATPRR